MSVVPNEPRKPGAFLLWWERRKGNARPETITVDLWSQRGDQEICLFKSAGNVRRRLPRVTELGITVPRLVNADDTSDCLRF